MSGPLRPKFSEGQILGAADLNAQVQYDRLGAVLHERTEHVWGVAQGLTLTSAPNKDSNNTPYVDVSLSPGRAVDRLGRSIVVTTAMPLDPGMFKQSVANRDKSKLYPVFVQAVEVSKTADTQPGKCSVNVITRVEESLQIVFGVPGSELAILDQAAATVDQDVDKSSLTDMVLVGWVQFDPSVSNGEGKFIGTATEGNGAKIRYVGVVASDVVAGGGQLTLHTRPDGQRFMLSITEDSQGGCLLAFGKQDGTNPIVPTFTVDDKGNITYQGSLSPSPKAKIQAQSGFALDGVTLPLPAGITQPDVDGHKVQLHMIVTPMPVQPVNTVLPNANVAVIPLVECSVDPDSRAVTSLVRWVDPADATVYLTLPNPCRYLIIASGV